VLISFCPPTHLRAAAGLLTTAVLKSADTAGVPSKRPAAGVAAQDTRSGFVVQ